MPHTNTQALDSAHVQLIKVAITGGPSGGKTTLIEALSKDFRGRVSVVAEAASILYRGGFPRRSHPLGKIHTQRAICFVQRELEDLVTAESLYDLNPNSKNQPKASDLQLGANKSRHIVVCDRGSLDSIAYWPGDSDDFFRSLDTTRVQELARYDWVIHLDTADQDSFDTSNPVRLENYKEAIQLNEMVKEAWAGHGRRVVIGHSSEFIQKITKAKKVIDMILEGQDFNSVFKALNPS
jgi:GTPase SAR1 family protein